MACGVCQWQIVSGARHRACDDLSARLDGPGAVLIGATNVPVNLSDWQSYNPISIRRRRCPHSDSRCRRSGARTAPPGRGVPPLRASKAPADSQAVQRHLGLPADSYG
jgi:amidase